MIDHTTNRQTNGRVFNIQRYSLHDGAGIRTLVFLKGCPLVCLWCSNPESQKAAPELCFLQSVCKGGSDCDAPCARACSEQAIQPGDNGIPQIDHERCNACGDCVDVCFYDALRVVGQTMSVAEVLEEVEKDRPFYRRSGGGLTLGGGDPLMQHQFCRALLEEAQALFIHTALETSGYLPWEQFEPVLRHVDQLYIDLKHHDDETHRNLTGKSNALILDNLARIPGVLRPQDVLIRIPLIPGCNDTEQNILASARFVAGLGYRQMELIPYHQFGVGKYEQYGRQYRLEGLLPLADEKVARLRSLVADAGLTEVSERC